MVKITKVATEEIDCPVCKMHKSISINYVEMPCPVCLRLGMRLVKPIKEYRGSPFIKVA